jgi:hypothetical protein
MGGHAYRIPVSVPDDLLPGAARQAPASRPFWKKIWHRPEPRPTVTELENGDRIYDIPAEPIDHPLVADFRKWLARRLPEPSDASKVVLEYITEITPNVYIRGTAHKGETTPSFWVQMSFSGCAGMAETSARVAGHWTGLWYRAEHERISDKYLRAARLIPDASKATTGDEEPYLFVPGGDLGYVEYLAPGLAGGEPEVSIDHSVAEAIEGDPRLDRLHEIVAPFISAGMCRCQLCAGDVDVTSF